MKIITVSTLLCLIGGLCSSSANAVSITTPTELIQDGGFEAAPSDANPAAVVTKVSGAWNWQHNWSGSSSTPRWNSSCHTGDWCLWFTGAPSMEVLYQTVTIPSGQLATLSFWLKVSVIDSGSTATFSVKLLDTSGGLLATLRDFSIADKSSYYNKYSFDVSAFSGRDVRVQFENYQYDDHAIFFFLDDVSLQSGVSAQQPLALSSGRVAVTVDWQNPYSGQSGRAYGLQKADEYAFFYYVDPNNPEVFVKVLDFGSGTALCFVGGLTDFYYKVTFRMVRTGQTLVFEKPPYQYSGFVDATTLRF